MEPMTQPPPDPLAALRRSRWRVLVVTGMGAFMGPLDVTVVALALPSMGRELGLTFSGAIWVQAGYRLMVTRNGGGRFTAYPAGG